MPELVIDLDDLSAEALRAKAEYKGLSVSEYARQQFICTNATWPASFWLTYGALDDDSFVAPKELDASLDRAIPLFD